MRKLFLAIFLLITVQVLSAQNISVSGVVKDKQTGELLIGASVFCMTTDYVTITNSKGEFNLEVHPNSYMIEVAYTGYYTYIDKVTLETDTVISYSLEMKAVQVGTVSVKRKREDDNVTSVTMGKTELTQEGLKSLPALMGEPDVVRALAIKGGVRQMEGMQGMSVRGGSQEQNLILFDEAIVFNPSHLLGFFSVFPSDIIQTATLYKSALPGEYGGRLSSLLKIDSKPPARDSLDGILSLGVLSSRAMVSIPLDDKSGITISSRNSYLDLFVLPIMNEVMQNSEHLQTSFGFYDASFRYEYRKDINNTFNISGYHGKDKFEMLNGKSQLRNDVSWGNTVYSFWWKHFSKNKHIHKFGFSSSYYEFAFNATQNYYELGIKTGVQNSKLFYQNSFKIDKSRIVYGGNIDFNQFNSGTVDAIVDGEKVDAFKPLNSQSIEASLFFEDKMNFTDKFSSTFSTRLIPYAQIGPYTSYEYDDENTVVDSSVYKWNDVIYNTLGFELRLQAKYSLTKNSSIKASVNRSNQHLHMVSMLSAALPADIWLPVSSYTPAPCGWSYNAGYFQNFSDNMYESSFSLFYKEMKNLVEFKDGFITLYAQSFNEKLAYGEGFAFGSEISIRKVKGDLQGGISYSFSRTLRRFDEINDNYLYPAAYDKPHDLSIQFHYKMSDKLSLSGLFVLSSGKVYSEPVSRYFINKNLINEYGPINNSRMPSYHRLDLSVDYKLVNKKAYNMFVHGNHIQY
jgi:hypothetical protein